MLRINLSGGLIIWLVLNLPGAVQAASDYGSVLTGSDDVLRFDLQGGLANPSPGIDFQGAILWTVRPADAYGLNIGHSRHEIVTENAKFSQEHLDAICERSWPLLDGFHALRLRGGLGLGRAHRAMDKEVAYIQGDKASRIYWGAHMSASLSFDLPIADLVWARVGFVSQKIFLEKTPTQSAIFGGVSWGGQWFGIGD